MARKYFLPIGLLWLAASLFTLINRGPFFFPDTTAYIRIADAAVAAVSGSKTVWTDRLQVLLGQDDAISTASQEQGAAIGGAGTQRVTPLAGRSIYYGFFLYLADGIGSLWLAALAQSLVVAVALTLAGRLLAPAMRAVHWMGLALITVVSGVGIFTGLLMPDIFAALAILSSAIIVSFWNIIGRGERAFWCLLLIVSILSHSATLLIVFAIFVVAFAARMGGKRFHEAIFAALVIGTAGELLFAAAVKYETGAAPLRPPFLSARLIADGPGKQYLERHCVDARWALCEFYDELPDHSDAILWNDRGTSFMNVQPESQQDWSRQDARFAVSVVVDDPISAAGALGASIFGQATSLGLADVTGPSLNPAKLPEPKRQVYLRTLASRGSFHLTGWEPLLGLMVVISIAILMLTRSGSFTSAVWIVAVGIAADVAICGAMSTPHDRYLTRVIWVLPVLAFLALVNRATSPSGQAAGATPPRQPASG